MWQPQQQQQKVDQRRGGGGGPKGSRRHPRRSGGNNAPTFANAGASGFGLAGSNLPSSRADELRAVASPSSLFFLLFLFFLLLLSHSCLHHSCCFFFFLPLLFLFVRVAQSEEMRRKLDARETKQLDAFLAQQGLQRKRIAKDGSCLVCPIVHETF